MNGVISLAGTSGLSVTGNGSANVVATGSRANLNAALTGMAFLPSAEYNGPASLGITVDDLGNTGSGGAQSASATVSITVDPVNDAPVAAADSYSVAEDGVLTVSAALGVLANDSDIDTAHSSLTAVPGERSRQRLVLHPQRRRLAQLHAESELQRQRLLQLPRANDGAANSNVVTVTITVSAVNDAPVITSPPAITTNEDMPATFSGTISIADPDAGSGSVTVTLAVTNGTLHVLASGATITNNDSASSQRGRNVVQRERRAERHDLSAEPQLQRIRHALHQRQ